MKMLRGWIHSKCTVRIIAHKIFAMGIVYLSVVCTWREYFQAFDFRSFQDMYSFLAIIQGVIFGIYANHSISRWWDLRLATGTVAGALSDIAMIVSICLGESVTEELSSLSRDLAGKLKHIHMLHVCDTLGVEARAYCQKPLTPVFFESDRKSDLIYCLSKTMELASTLVCGAPVPDPMKFSATSAIQADISAIRSSNGDCSMILNTRQPRSFTAYVWVFSCLHLACVPLYIGTQSEWNSIAIISGSLSAFSLIGGFLVIVLHDFTNPFMINTFILENILEGTFRTIDDCLMGPSEISRAKRL